MKKSYIKILIIEILMLLSLVINGFVLKNTVSYYPLLFIFVFFFIIITLTLGYEKDNHRFKKDVLLSVLIYISIFFLLYYLISIPFGYLRNGYTFNVQTILKILLPNLLIIISSELLRYSVVTKSKGFNLGIVLITLIMIFSDVYFEIIKVQSYNFEYILKLICNDLLPAIFKNIFLTYISYKVGFRTPIIYRLIMEITFFIVPIVPNYSEYLDSIINTVFPLLILFSIKKDFNDDPKKDVKYGTYVITIFLVLLMSLMIILSSGMFKIYSIAIASNSMAKTINKGDIVVVEKVDKIKKLKVGDILVFENDKKIIVHRIINIYEIDNKYYFETQGDNNPYKDGFITGEEQVKGKVITKLPFMGWPSVWVNEFMGGSN